MRDEFLKKTVLAGIAAAVIFAAHAGPAEGRDWYTWKGSGQDGISDETGWDPSALNRPLRVNWEINVGEGYSNVSIKGNRLYTMGYDRSSGKNILYCLDVKTGEEIWRYAYEAPRGRYSGPKGTPVLDGGRVYTFSQGGDFKCNDVKTGELIWHRQVVNELGSNNPMWQFPSSVRIEGPAAIVNASTSGVALDKETGEVIWASASGTGNYATPVTYTSGGRTLAVIVGRNRIYSVDVADGEVKWSYPWNTPRNITAADPFIYDEKMYISSGYRHGGALLDISGPEPELLWQNDDLRSHFTSPVIIDGYIYGIDGNAGSRAHLKCLDMRDGSVRWSEETGFANMMVADGHFILVTERGDLIIARVDPSGYREVSRAAGVLGRVCWTAPLLLRSTIYVRNDEGNIVSLDVSGRN